MRLARGGGARLGALAARLDAAAGAPGGGRAGRRGGGGRRRRRGGAGRPRARAGRGGRGGRGGGGRAGGGGGGGSPPLAATADLALARAGVGAIAVLALVYFPFHVALVGYPATLFLGWVLARAPEAAT